MFRKQTDKKIQSISGTNPTISFAASTMQGWRSRMEDTTLSIAELFDPSISLFGVFDGHGGSEVARYCQLYFAEILVCNPHFSDHKYEQALVETFLQIDSKLQTEKGRQQVSSLNPNRQHQYDQSSTGSTGIVCLLTKQWLYVANVGDSRCVVASLGKALQMSLDHKPTEKAEIERIKNAGGYVTMGRVNGDLSLSRAIGDFGYKNNPGLKQQHQVVTAKPDVRKMKTNEIDFIILASDGVWECRPNQSIINYYYECIAKDKTLIQCNEELLLKLLAKDNQYEIGVDNMSLISVSIRR